MLKQWTSQLASIMKIGYMLRLICYKSSLASVIIRLIQSFDQNSVIHVYYNHRYALFVQRDVYQQFWIFPKGPHTTSRHFVLLRIYSIYMFHLL